MNKLKCVLVALLTVAGALLTGGIITSNMALTTTGAITVPVLAFPTYAVIVLVRSKRTGIGP